MYDQPIELYKRLGDLLIVELEKDTALVQIAALEALRYELAQVMASTLEELYKKRAQYLYPRDKGLTELDRTTSLNGSLAQIESDYLFQQKLWEIVADRISLGVAILKQ